LSPLQPSICSKITLASCAPATKIGGHRARRIQLFRQLAPAFYAPALQISEIISAQRAVNDPAP
jgi:hypothetical protein